MITQSINHCQYNCINDVIVPFSRYFVCHLQMTLQWLLFKRYSSFETIATVTFHKNSHDSQPKFMKWPLPQQPWPQQWPLNVTATKLISWQNQQLPSPMPPERGYISIYLIIQLTNYIGKKSTCRNSLKFHSVYFIIKTKPQIRLKVDCCFSYVGYGGRIVRGKNCSLSHSKHGSNGESTSTSKVTSMATLAMTGNSKGNSISGSKSYDGNDRQQW